MNVSMFTTTYVVRNNIRLVICARPFRNQNSLQILNPFYKMFLLILFILGKLGHSMGLLNGLAFANTMKQSVIAKFPHFMSQCAKTGTLKFESDKIKNLLDQKAS